MFMADDKVVCISADNSGEELIIGKTYTVKESYISDYLGEEFVILKETHIHTWYSKRFKLVQQLTEEDML